MKFTLQFIVFLGIHAFKCTLVRLKLETLAKVIKIHTQKCECSP